MIGKELGVAGPGSLHLGAAEWHGGGKDLEPPGLSCLVVERCFSPEGFFHKDKRPVFHQGSRYGLQLLTAPARTKFPSKMIKDVNLDTVGSRKMCVTVWSLPTVYFYRRAVLVFLSYVHFSWQVWDFLDILKSEMMVCVTGAGHRIHLHPCGRCGFFCTLGKPWQAWVDMQGGFGDHFCGRRSIW